MWIAGRCRVIVAFAVTCTTPFAAFAIACGQFGDEAPRPPPEVDASPREPSPDVVVSDSEVDAGPFRCDTDPAFEAPLTSPPPSPPTVARGVISLPDPNGHLLLVPADLGDAGLGERTGALWVSGILAGATGFRATFEYSAYVVSGAGEGFALAWAASSVPAGGSSFGVCGSGVPGHALVLPTPTTVPTVVRHETEPCDDPSSGGALVGSKLLTSANTPSPWYAVDVTVAARRVSYAIAELGFGSDAGPAVASWQGSFEQGGFAGTTIAHVGLTARTGGPHGNTAQRVRNLRVFRCQGN